MAGRLKPPIWFWLVTIVILAWGAMGIFAFYADRTMDAAAVARMSDYDRNFRVNQPAWEIWAYAVAVWTGFIGAIALLVRSRHAHPVFVVSLVAVVALFGWIFVATDMIAVKGPLVATGFPIFIAVAAVAQIWFADYARKREWIG
ncbi:hypothetical protein GCM10011395_32170 [Sphingomonas psychrolutea]|uniref:Sugar transporter n=1 Tax=Sphingomonas psychrolutea TaxID=1259676 RepID=A0ABQ1H6G8_9SPHN|nr:hypothetical protein GCM10011395_32170 [Sphingomonas psychrolutea]